MKSLREWIEGELAVVYKEQQKNLYIDASSYEDGKEWAFEVVLDELKAREEQAKEDNWRAAKDGNHLAGLLHEIEGSIGSLSDTFDECVIHAEKDEYYVHVESAGEDFIHVSVAAQKLKEQAERWRSLFVELLTGDMTHERIAEFKKGLSIVENASI